MNILSNQKVNEEFLSLNIGLQGSIWIKIEWDHYNTVVMNCKGNVFNKEEIRSFA